MQAVGAAAAIFLVVTIAMLLRQPKPETKDAKRAEAIVKKGSKES